MLWRFAATASFAIGAIAGPAPLGAAIFGPVTISSCTMLESNGQVASNGVHIKFFNNQPNRTLVSITFAVRYHGMWNLITENGHFRTNEPISRRFNNFAGTTWVGPDPRICRADRALYVDGQIWNF